MASLDTNIIIIALPAIASDLHTSLLTLVWIVLGYWLVTASILMNLGRLSDMFGRVRLYNLGFIVFTAGSGLCSISQTGEQLMLFRIVQALGAAFLFSNSAAIITDAFPEEERGRALGLNQVSIVVGSVIGLVFGGFLTSYLGWRSIFWVNLPIGIFAIIWSYTKLHELGSIKKEKIDWFGNAALAGGLFLILIGITFGSFGIFGSNNTGFSIYVFVIAGLGLIVLFVFIEKNTIRPMFDLSLFRIKEFVGGDIAIFLNALARGAFTLVMTFYLQGPSMRLTPLEAGIYLIPISLSLSICGPISGWIADKYVSASRILPPVGLFTSAVGFFMLTQVGIKVSLTDTLLPLTLIGAGMGIFASPNRAIIMSSVPKNRRGIAAGTSTTLVVAGSTLSLGLAFLIMTHIMPLTSVENVMLATFGNQNQNHIGTTKDSGMEGFVSSIHFIFFLSAILMLVSIVPSVIREKRPRREQASH
jgi:EmrB/QacA subfamily drug resistance transporter